MKLTGINIFTYAKSPMKELVALLFILISGVLSAQVRIHADDTSACNSAIITFDILPASALDTITTVEWNFGNWTATSIEMTPSVLYNNPGTFDVICTINGTYTITENAFISIKTCSDTLDLPNVFSPNDDNINDRFAVETNGISSYSFVVYTRSGSLVYKTESPTIEWDGRSLSGQKMKNGIYYYTIRQLDGKPLNEFKGIVYLFE